MDLQNLTPEKIKKKMETDPDSIVALILFLIDENTKLKQRVKELEDRLDQNSGNSNKPPSTDGFNKPNPKSLRGNSGKKNGAQYGHKGHHLEMAEHPDHIITHKISSCKACNRSFLGIDADGYEPRQVYDLVVRMEVTEHRVEQTCCPDCGHHNQAVFPDGVSYLTQYGNSVKAALCYFNIQQLLPLNRVSQMVEDLTGHRISEGTIVNVNETVYEKLSFYEERVKKALQAAPVLHGDESGLYVQGKRHWLHVVTDGQHVLYTTHTKRGKEGMDAGEVLPDFNGTLVRDGWVSYDQYSCKQALCNTHHHRELNGVIERDHQSWSEAMIELLYEIKDSVAQSRNAGLFSLDADQIATFETRYETIIKQGHGENPPPPPDAPKKKGRVKQSKTKNLLDRLDKKRSAVLMFMVDFRVPFTNNEAERCIRMIKLQQKTSGTFRSEEGPHIFCRIRGYIATIKKNGLSILDAIRRTLDDQPFIPNVPD